MEYKIEVENCCGSHCAKYFQRTNEKDLWHKLYHTKSVGAEFQEWYEADRYSHAEAVAEHKSMRFALDLLLTELVAAWVFTQEQADAERLKWERENVVPEPALTAKFTTANGVEWNTGKPDHFGPLNRDVILLVQKDAEAPAVEMVGYFGSMGPNWAIYHDPKERDIFNMWERVPESVILGWREEESVEVEE